MKSMGPGIYVDVPQQFLRCGNAQCHVGGPVSIGTNARGLCLIYKDVLLAGLCQFAST